MRKHILILCVLVILITGCRRKGPEALAVGGYGSVSAPAMGAGGRLSSSDRQELESAKAVAAKYTGAWIDRDYRTMYALGSRRDRRAYWVFKKMSSVWRTKGFTHREALTHANRARIASTLQLLPNVTDEQAKIMLALAVVKRDTCDDMKAGRWPDRVAFLTVEIASERSLLTLVKEDGNWVQLAPPGQLGEDIIKAMQGKQP